MILRKPYAFLIKNFKIIHLFISILMGYLLYKSYNIVTFFSDSVTNNYTAIVSGQVAGLYINYFMYGAIILVLASLVAIYYLLSHKDKPRKFYMWSILYYILLFIVFTIFYSFINTLTNETIASSSLRAYRDISVMITVPQIFFVIYTFVTFTGFNIKKFNFSDDLKELEINEEDNAEFEFTIGFKGYKTERKIRRTIREFSYYVRENSFIFTIISIISVIIVATTLFLNREVYNKKYKMSDSILHNNFAVSVEDSIVSNLTYNGEILSKGKYYVAIKLKVTNNSNKKEVLDHSNFRLEYDNKQVKPNLEKSLFFKDFATPYYGDEISKGSSRVIGLVYEINEKDKNKAFKLKIYRGVNTKPGEIVAKYNEIKIAPVLVNELADSNVAEMGESLEFIYSNIGDSSFQINSFQFTKGFQYSYDKCENEVCRTIDDIVSVDYTVLGDYRMLLVLDYILKLDKETAYYKGNSAIKDFVTNFMKIRYTIDENTYYSKVVYQTPKNLKDKMVLQVKSNVNEAETLDIIFTIRNKNYIINLK